MKNPFIESLEKDLEKIDEKSLHIISQKVSDGEKIVKTGELDIELKKLYTFVKNTEEKVFSSALKSFFKMKGINEIKEENEELLTKASFAEDLFWNTIQHSYGLWGKSIGIREGYKVVIIPKKEDINFPDFFKEVGLLEFPFSVITVKKNS